MAALLNPSTLLSSRRSSAADRQSVKRDYIHICGNYLQEGRAVEARDHVAVLVDSRHAAAMFDDVRLVAGNVIKAGLEVQ